MMSVFTMLAAAASHCTPVAGADRLWLPATRWVIVGEIHGTNETPDAFANLVCLARLSGRPVTVALEYVSDSQAVIDAYLRSDGGADAKAQLLSLPEWHQEFQDGRTSVAFLRMFDRFRKMKRDGIIAGVICSDVAQSRAAGRARDAAMAEAWKAIRTAEHGIVLALVGNVHAMRRTVVRPEFKMVTAASLMPAAETITINVVSNGGKTWDCEANGCGEHISGVQHPSTTGIVFASDASDPWGATYELGKPTTAALPAIPPRQSSGSAVPIHIKNN